MPHLGYGVAQVQSDGLSVLPELLARISPLGWAHILLTGEHRWSRTVADTPYSVIWHSAVVDPEMSHLLDPCSWRACLSAIRSSLRQRAPHARPLIAGESFPCAHPEQGLQASRRCYALSRATAGKPRREPGEPGIMGEEEGAALSPLLLGALRRDALRRRWPRERHRRSRRARAVKAPARASVLARQLSRGFAVEKGDRSRLAYASGRGGENFRPVARIGSSSPVCLHGPMGSLRRLGGGRRMRSLRP